MYHVQTAVDFKAKTEKVVITPYVNGDMDTENAVTLNLDIKNATATAFSMLGVSHAENNGTIHVLTDNIKVRTAASSSASSVE